MKKYYFSFAGNSCFLLLTSMLFCDAIFALPEHAVIIDGDVDLSFDDKNLTVDQSSQTAIVNYDSFSVADDESVNIHQPNSDALLLNRVVGNELSEIYGQINANGKVLLVNQNGVFFGESAQVDVGGLLVSSQNILNEDIRNGNIRFDPSTDGGSIVNQGNITTQGVDGVVFVAPVVINQGNITAVGGDVSIATSDAVFIKNDDSPISILVNDANSDLATSIENHGRIRATRIENSGGDIYLSGGQQTDIYNYGEINTSDDMSAGSDSSSTLINGAGDVVIRGNRISHQGIINASVIDDGRGGNIELRSRSFTSVGENSETLSNGGELGQGGEVILFSSHSTRFDSGAIVEAKGGRVSGDGGYVDVSGLQHVEVYGSVDVSSQLGKQGAFLIDPDDITITNADNLVTSGSPFQSSSSGTSTLDVATLEAALNGGGNIEVRTDVEFGDGESGDITVAVDINLDGANGGSLTLNALGDINLASGVEISDQNNGTVDDVAISLVAGGSVNMIDQADILAGVGTISIDAGGSLTIGTLASDNNSASAISINAASIIDEASAVPDISATNGGVDITVAGDISPVLGLSMDVDQLTLDAGGNVWIRNEGDLIVRSVANVNDFTLQLNAGDLTIPDAGISILGDLIINAVDINDDVDRNINLSAQSAFLDISNLNTDTVINTAFQQMDLSVLGNGDLSINNAGDLQLIDGDADSVVGVYRTDSMSIATTIGDLTISNDMDIDSSDSTLILSANGTLILDDGISIADQTPDPPSVDLVNVILNSGGSFTLNDTHEVNSSTGTLSITSNGDVTITNVESMSPLDNAITVTSVNGVIRDGGDASTDISAELGGVVLSSFNGVDNIELETPILSLSNTNSGNVVLHQQNNLDIDLTALNVNGNTTIDGVGDVRILDVAPTISGDLNITTQIGSSITLPDSGLMVSGGINFTTDSLVDSDNVISLGADSATLDLRNTALPSVINSQINNLSIINSSINNVTINNDRELTVDMLLSSGDMFIGTTSGNINISNGIDLDVANGLDYTFNSDQDINLANNVVIQDQDTVTADDVNLVFNAGRDINASNNNVIDVGAGSININAGGRASVSGLVSNSASATAIRINAGNIQGLGGAAMDLSAPNGGVELTSNTAIEGQSSGFLNLDTQVLALTMTGLGDVRIQAAGDLNLDSASGLTASNFVVGGVLTIPDSGVASNSGLLSILANDLIDSDRSLTLQADQLLLQLSSPQADSIFNTSVNEIDITYGGNNNVSINNDIGLVFSDLNADQVAASVNDGNLNVNVADGDLVVNADILASDLSADGVRSGLIDIVVNTGNINIGGAEASSIVNIRSNNTLDTDVAGGLGSGIAGNPNASSIHVQLANNELLRRSIRIGSASNRVNITAIGGDVDIDAVGVARNDLVSQDNVIIALGSVIEAYNDVNDPLDGEVYFNSIVDEANPQISAHNGRRIAFRPAPSLIDVDVEVTEEVTVGIDDSQSRAISDNDSVYEPENIADTDFSYAIGGHDCVNEDKDFSRKCFVFKAVKKALTKWTLGGQMPPNVNALNGGGL